MLPSLLAPQENPHLQGSGACEEHGGFWSQVAFYVSIHPQNKIRHAPHMHQNLVGEDSPAAQVGRQVPKYDLLERQVMERSAPYLLR